jgi:hypothetical protein
MKKRLTTEWTNEIIFGKSEKNEGVQIHPITYAAAILPMHTWRVCADNVRIWINLGWNSKIAQVIMDLFRPNSFLVLTGSAFRRKRNK